MTETLPAITALVLSAALTWLLIRLAWRLRLVDQPDPRKVHRHPTPRIGGLAFVPVCVGVALGVQAIPGLAWAPGLGIFLVGLADDRWGLSWQLRLGLQFLLAALAVLGLEGSGPLLWVLGTFWLVTLVNALNMLDNMDLLSGGTAWLAGLALFCLGCATGDPALARRALILMAALAGFLLFNWPPARAFMGDAGSNFLGFWLGLESLRLLIPGPPAETGWRWATPLILLALPLYDLVTVVLLRLREGRSPFQADRCHVSHRLVARGLPPLLAVASLHLLALASGAAAVLLQLAVDWRLAALAVGQFLAFWAAFAVVDQTSC